MSSLLRTTAWGASVLAITLAAGCSRSELQDMTPPSSTYVEAPPAPLPPPPPAPPRYGQARPGELLGGPAPYPNQRPLGPNEGLPPEFGAMAPIPNPEDMDPAERAEVYGDKAGSYSRAERRAESRGDVPRGRQAAGRSVPQSGHEAPARDIARPAAPVTARASVAPAKPAAPAPAKPAAPEAPAMAAKPSEPVKPAAPLTKAEQLGAALESEVASKSVLDIPPAIAAGDEGVIVLTVPNGLLGRVRAEAEKLGLGVAAKTVDVRAKLSGAGYDVVPNDTQTARLREGEPTSFSWQVTPGAGEKGLLKAEVEGALQGGDKPVAFPLATVGQPGAGDDSAQTITVPDPQMVTIPGIGQVRSGLVLLVGLALLVTLILAALGRNARERRRAAQRERARESRAEFSPGEAAAQSDAAPAPVKTDPEPG